MIPVLPADPDAPFPPMQRALRGAEALPEEQAQQLLELELALNDGMAAADANNEDE